MTWCNSWVTKNYKLTIYNRSILKSKTNNRFGRNTLGNSCMPPRVEIESGNTKVHKQIDKQSFKTNDPSDEIKQAKWNKINDLNALIEKLLNTFKTVCRDAKVSQPPRWIKFGSACLFNNYLIWYHLKCFFIPNSMKVRGNHCMKAAAVEQ